MNVGHWNLSPWYDSLQIYARYYYYCYVKPTYESMRTFIHKKTGLISSPTDDFYDLNRMMELDNYKKVTKVDWELLSTMRTGDIILFNTFGGFFQDIVEYGTLSKYSHVAMVITKPFFDDIYHFSGDKKNNKHNENNNDDDNNNPKLPLVLMIQSGYEESATDVEDGKRKFGVQITHLDKEYIENYNGNLYWRPLLHSESLNSFFDNEENQKIMNKALKETHHIIHNKPYDIHPLDFLKAGFDIEIGNNQITDRFFCSALVAYLYYKMGFLPEPKDIHKGWDLVTPKMWSSDANRILPLNEKVTLGEQISFKYEVYEYQDEAESFKNKNAARTAMSILESDNKTVSA